MQLGEEPMSCAAEEVKSVVGDKRMCFDAKQQLHRRKIMKKHAAAAAGDEECTK